MMKQRLSTSASATLNAAGYGTVAIGPVTPGSVWHITRLTTNGGSDPEPKHRIYRGQVHPTRVLDFTERGNGDVSEADIRLYAGETIIAEWEDGAPAMTMTLVIEGEATDQWNADGVS